MSAPTNTFASLRFPAYRLWFAGALVANVGTWMQRIAQDWLVLTDLSNDSGMAVGLVTALQFLPALLLGPYAGVLADRLPRRAMLVVTQSLMGLLALGLGVLTLTGQAQMWQVLAFAFGLGIVSALDNPVRQTFVAELVPAHTLPNAVALNSASFNAARLIGPGVAGLAIAAMGAGWVFILNAASFAFTIAALALMRRRDLFSLPSASRESGQVREGFRFVRQRPDLILIMAVVGVVSAFGLNFQLTSAMMARTVFDQGAADYGILGSILAIGSLSGALAAARRGEPRVRRVVLAALGFGIASGVMALAPTYWTYALAAIPVGYFSLTMLATANSYVQTSVAPAMRGRVMSLYLMVLLGATPFGSPVVGWIGENWGARWSIGIGVITTVAVAVVAGQWAWRHWDLELRLDRSQRPHLVLTSERERCHAAA